MRVNAQFWEDLKVGDIIKGLPAGDAKVTKISGSGYYWIRLNDAYAYETGPTKTFIPGWVIERQDVNLCGSGGVSVPTQKETTSVCLYAYPTPVPKAEVLKGKTLSTIYDQDKQKLSHLQSIKRTMRETPFCTFSGTYVSLGLREDKAFSEVNYTPVFHCHECGKDNAERIWMP